MSGEEILLTLAAVLVFSAIVVVANYADREKNASARRWVMGTLGLINTLIVVVYGVLQVAMAYAPEVEGLAGPEVGDAWVSLLASCVVAGLATALLAQSVRERIALLFPHTPPLRLASESGVEERTTSPPAELQPKPDGLPLFPQMLNYYTTESTAAPRLLPRRQTDDTSWPAWRMAAGAGAARGFNPASTVHTVALLLCVYVPGVQIINFILGGGLQGVAQLYADGLSGWDLLINAVPFVVLSLLGVGYGLRRDARQVLDRLGLGRLTPQGAVAAVAVTVALFVFVAAVSMLWMAIVSEDTYEEQTQAADALSESVTTLGLALLLSATAAVGEEIAFRGALQPVFGLWPTAIVFALTHAQYTLTPAWLIILGVAVAFGWVRQRYNTTAAILTHFMYNFIPLAVAVFAPEETAALVLRLL